MNKKLWHLGLAVLLISLATVMVFTNLSSKRLALAQSNAVMTNLTFGISQFPFPDDAVRCPGQKSPVMGTFSITGGSTQYSADIWVKLYGKYKTEKTWNYLAYSVLLDNNYQYETSVWTTKDPLGFTLPQSPDNDSTFQLRALGAAIPSEQRLTKIVNLSPDGVPQNAQCDIKTEYDILTIYNIRIYPKNPVTGEPITLFANLTDLDTANLGIYSGQLTPEVTWEVRPTGSRTTMSPQSGGAPIEKMSGTDNPWTVTPPVDTHGAKIVKVNVRWNDKSGQEVYSTEKKKKFNLYFRTDAKDYGGNEPNWYYYWSTHDDGAVRTRGFDVSDTKTYRYASGGAARQYGQTNPVTGLTTIFDAAHLSLNKVITYYDAENEPHSYTFNTIGIDTLAHNIGHERAHKDVYDNLHGGSWASLTDTDCDGIPDIVESGLGLDPTTPDSSHGTYTQHWGASATDSTNPKCVGVISVDEEIYCDLMSQKSASSVASNDWSDTGKQINNNPAFSVNQEIYNPIGDGSAESLASNDWSNTGNTSNLQFLRLAAENGTAATLTGKFSEYGKDTNSNGLFDSLTVRAEVNVTSPGTYSLQGLLSKDPDFFNAENDSCYFTIGLHNFTIGFDGGTFRTLRLDGPFNLESISLFSANGVDSRENVLNTSSYSYKQFEQQAAELTGSFSESTADTNGDSLFDRLDVSVAINVTEPGNYTLTGDLNLNNNGVVVSTNSSYLNRGEQTVTLSYDGLEMRAHRANGHYTLMTVEISNQSGNQIDILGDAYNTSAHSYTQFARPAAELTGIFSSFGVDTDSNGLFNILKVQAQVDVEQAGNYTFSADLSDLNSNDITSNSTTVLLNAGLQNVTLGLDGVAIGDNGAAGPYVLTSLELFNSDGALLSAEPYYVNTSSYSNSQFDRAGKIVGTIQGQDGTPVENAHVYINDDNDTLLSSTYTDANGTYSFTGLDTGTYNLLVSVSGSNLNIQTANASVTKGQTAEVDFTFNNIPESPSLLVLPLFNMMTIVAAAAYRKMKKRQKSRSLFNIGNHDRHKCNK